MCQVLMGEVARLQISGQSFYIPPKRGFPTALYLFYPLSSRVATPQLHAWGKETSYDETAAALKAPEALLLLPGAELLRFFHHQGLEVGTYPKETLKMRFLKKEKK